MVMPYTGDPHIGGIPGPWMEMMSQLVPESHVPYKVRMNLITEVTKPTVDDQVPEVRDSHEASQDQAEEASDDKGSRCTEVEPVASTGFSFSTTDSEFNPEAGQFPSMKLRCPICAPTGGDAHTPILRSRQHVFVGSSHAENTRSSGVP